MVVCRDLNPFFRVMFNLLLLLPLLMRPCFLTYLTANHANTHTDSCIYKNTTN